MRWAIAAAVLVIAANGAVLVSASRERSAPLDTVTIDVCAGHLVGGSGSENAPALRLRLRRDTVVAAQGLDAAGLRALGFPEATIATVGKPRPEGHSWRPGRPAWVRIRQGDDSLRSFLPVEVSPSRRQLPPDGTSLVVRGIVILQEESSDPAAGHDPGGPPPPATRGALQPVVSEILPRQLHLDRDQIATLRTALPGSLACDSPRSVVIGQSARGGIWVQEVR